MSQLTAGAIRRMNESEGQQDDPSFAPVLQLMAVKAVGGSSDRFRTILSDGEHYVQGMLATQINHLVHSGEISDNSIVRVDDFMNNSVQNRTVIIVLGLTVMDTNAERIGAPVDIEKAGGGGASSSSSTAKPMYNRTNQVVPNQQSSSNSIAKPDPARSGNSNPYGGSGGQSNYGNQNRYSGSSAPIVPSNTMGGGPPITPISQLNMYQNRWTIKARVTSKSDIRTWSNARGEGSLFSVDLLDSSGMDIRATLFKEAVDKFYNFLEMDKVYTFSGGRLKVANMQYNTCKSNFEVTFDQNSEIHLDNDNGEIQQQIYEFVKIADIENVEAGKNIDVLGVVKGVGETQSLTSKKTGKELQKCDLTLVDDSGVEINMTVWGERARSAPTEFSNAPVCAFRRARVSDYGGKSLSASPTIVIQPRIPESGQLQKWWKSGGAQTTRSLSSSGGGGGGKIEDLFNRKSISAIKNENMGYSNPDKPDWISFKGTFTFLKKDKEGGAWYCACANANDPCKNRFKVNQTTDGNWFCDKCQGTYPNCVRRWIFSGTVTDDTCTTWVSLFNEQAEVLFDGATADDVYNQTMGDNPDQDAYDSYFAKASFTEYLFKCKVKQENVGDETRVKTSVFSMQPVDYAKESRDLLTAISKF
mmetsp:Transcript_21096/g.29794  ORF Transcript_21096/g.29794 Transcript_21096/m.29794 type:complete len:643 (-) Transcript_21096:211-2139(-)